MLDLRDFHEAALLLLFTEINQKTQHIVFLPRLHLLHPLVDDHLKDIQELTKILCHPSQRSLWIEPFEGWEVIR